jgi:hypothetical protein
MRGNRGRGKPGPRKPAKTPSKQALVSTRRSSRKRSVTGNSGGDSATDLCGTAADVWREQLLCPNVKHVKHSWSLNKTKALGKKLHNITAPHDLLAEPTDGGVRVYLSTIFYELFTRAAIKHIQSLSMYEPSLQVVEDAEGTIVTGTVRATSSINKSMSFTVNFYPTTSSLLINGNHQDRFYKYELPKIAEKAAAMGKNIDTKSLKAKLASEIAAAIQSNQDSLHPDGPNKSSSVTGPETLGELINPSEERLAIKDVHLPVTDADINDIALDLALQDDNHAPIQGEGGQPMSLYQGTGM